MQHRLFPIIVYASADVRRAIGPDLGKAAGLALRALLKERRSVEIAHKQVVYRRCPIAFSSRVGVHGALILELDVGNPNLADRVVLEEDLKRSAQRNGLIEGRGAGRTPARRR